MLTPNDLTRLANHSREYLGDNCDMTFRVTCRDAVRTFDELSTLLAFDNVSSRAIKKILISGSSSDLRKRVKMVLGRTNPLSKGMEIQVSGHDVGEPQIQNVIATLEEDIAATAPWYSMISTVSFINIAMAVSLLITAISSVAVIAKGGTFQQFKDTFSSVSAIVGVLFFVTLTWAIVAGLHTLRCTVFPLATFAIGNGERRHTNAEVWRVGVIIAFVVGIASSIVVGIAF